MTRASEEWELVKFELRDRSKHGKALESGRPQAIIQSPGCSFDGYSNDGYWSRGKKNPLSTIPIMCHKCVENGHMLMHCEKDEQGGEARGPGKGETGPGPGNNVQKRNEQGGGIAGRMFSARVGGGTTEGAVYPSSMRRGSGFPNVPANSRR